MAAGLDHTIVPVKDQEESVEFYTRIFDFEYTGRGGRDDRFAVVRVNDGFTLDFEHSDNVPAHGLHYAFYLDPDRFEGAFQRIQESGIPYGDGPMNKTNMRGPGKSSGAKGETRSVYFSDPSGHRLEILTYP